MPAALRLFRQDVTGRVSKVLQGFSGGAFAGQVWPGLGSSTEEGPQHVSLLRAPVCHSLSVMAGCHRRVS